MDPAHYPLAALTLPAVYVVTSTESPEFSRLQWTLIRSVLVSLDAEWKPVGSEQSSFPVVALLQIACRLKAGGDDTHGALDFGEDVVFLLDLLAIHLHSIYELLNNLFIAPGILKLGFRFKQDLVYLSSTFSSEGCTDGFDRVEPFLDIASVYSFMRHKHLGRKISKEMKSLSTICRELLGISLSKELQCSDWSCRPLSEEQKIYAAVDAYCLLQIFSVFEREYSDGGTHMDAVSDQTSHVIDLGLKAVFHENKNSSTVARGKFFGAQKIVAACAFESPQNDLIADDRMFSYYSAKGVIPFGGTLLNIIRRYGDKIVLSELDKKPKSFRRKKERRLPAVGLLTEERELKNFSGWQGPPPWDSSVGGDGTPKFLCDVMVEGLARHLRCVGIDAAVPNSKKPEVIEAFGLKICENQLMSRCTKCNGQFIQKPLTAEEAVEVAKGFQVIPSCLFDKNLEFWQCVNCNQLYWEGTQYHNAIRRFVAICKLNE